MLLAAVLFAAVCLAVVAPTQPVQAQSCTWVDGTIGNVYTDMVWDVWYGHRTLFIWNGSGAPDVDSVYYWVNGGWIYIPSGSIITYSGTYQVGPSSGWWGWYIDTTATIVNPWFNGDEGYWDDDWRWGAYINC